MATQSDMPKVYTKKERKSTSRVLALVLKHMSDELQQQVKPFIKEIERYIHRQMDEVYPERVGRKEMKFVRAAVIYDAFRMFEHRTFVRVGSPFIQKALGTNMGTVSNTWKKLFDTRIRIDRSRLESIYVTRQKMPEIVSMIFHQLRRTLAVKPPEVEQWLREVEMQAKTLVEQVSSDERYHPEVIAGAAVYAAIQFNAGIPVVNITMQDINFASTYSGQSVRMAWNDLFRVKCISRVE